MELLEQFLADSRAGDAPLKVVIVRSDGSGEFRGEKFGDLSVQNTRDQAGIHNGRQSLVNLGSTARARLDRDGHHGVPNPGPRAIS